MRTGGRSHRLGSRNPHAFQRYRRNPLSSGSPNGAEARPDRRAGISGELPRYAAGGSANVRSLNRNGAEGEWKQNNSNDPENSWQSATITGDTIEVNWVADGGDTKSLYWAGTVEVPAEGESFSFDSANDTTKTESAMLASSDPTKTFTYENDELSYEVTAMGTTMTVRLSRE